MRKEVLRQPALLLASVTLLGSLTGLIYLLERHETTWLVAVYSLAFLAYLGCVLLAQSSRTVSWLLGVAVVSRLLLLPAVPNLSDDIYRFVWDGHLLRQGVNPFAYLPSELMAGKADSLGITVDQGLYTALNSPDYHTIYPPINQAVFTAAVAWFPDSLRGSTIVIRGVLLLAELGTMWLLIQLARLNGLPRQRMLWYALNPLVILEMTGNLHFEALMIFFVVGSIYLYQKQHWVPSALSFGLAVCTKLLPLMLLPLFLQRLGWQKVLVYYALVGLTTVALFLPLLSEELVQGLRSSIGLYFRKFEFNASIYYVVREIGYYRKGYNVIQTAGQQLAVVAFLAIVLYTILERQRQLLNAFGWVWLIYLLFALTVHPWYVVPLLAFTVLMAYRYAVGWTYFVFLTYAGYSADGFRENLGLVALEYLVVLGWLGYELYRHRSAHRSVLPPWLTRRLP